MPIAHMCICGGLRAQPQWPLFRRLRFRSSFSQVFQATPVFMWSGIFAFAVRLKVMGLGLPLRLYVSTSAWILFFTRPAVTHLRG